MAKLKKSGGTTPTERHLAQLCEKTFLHLWSYPNLHRDQGGCKELCDLLVVFGKDVIIFSDKSCAFPNSGDITKDWQRWFRKAIKKSADQIFGAERWIKTNPNRIFLDGKCEACLPIELPSPDTIRFHRIVVARGAGPRCSEFFGGDTGSLMVHNDIIGKAHIDPNMGSFNVFKVGQIDPDKGFVHVLDDTNLEIVLTELDTVADFVDYLIKKERLYLSDRMVWATGEEDLLAYYLTHMNKDGEHDFDFSKDQDLIVIDDCYAGMAADHQYIAKKLADKESYLWDRLIDHIGRHVLEGTLAFGDEFNVSDHEKGLHVLASESRLARRGLAKALLDRIESAPENRPSVRVVVSGDSKGTGYCFLIYPYRQGDDYEEYRRKRSGMLVCYCKVMKLKFPELEWTVGIAMEPAGVKGGSEDLVYLDGTDWTEIDRKEARLIQKKMGILKSPRISHFHDEEYPKLDDGTWSPGTAQRLNRRERRAKQAKQKRKKKNQ